MAQHYNPSCWKINCMKFCFNLKAKLAIPKPRSKTRSFWKSLQSSDKVFRMVSRYFQNRPRPPPSVFPQFSPGPPKTDLLPNIACQLIGFCFCKWFEIYQNEIKVSQRGTKISKKGNQKTDPEKHNKQQSYSLNAAVIGVAQTTTNIIQWTLKLRRCHF